MYLKQITAFITLASVLFAAQVFAASDYLGPDRDGSGNIVPTPKGESCVEETSYMRKNHMDLLLHKRNETMRKGIRTENHSLTSCIECHATPAEDGKIARITEDKHFCASCHTSAAVKLDCFECHADRPVSAFKKSSLKNTDSDLLQILTRKQALLPHAVLNQNTQLKGDL
ncbi:MAG: hypothetical protein ISR69_00180 [Gammaproteobacteria bacterium]|nr:hypothetical protein [Gammaproteobacteria bacterium]